ncbi:hypothetical protein [Hyunsoonleella ulvae]|uniref:hypothetical protein n=1 Tax=Hyunsoonleella ulvae TaxID=2799948 RepID=UPI001939A812|nr:hypothetical protein [Hyunsoonleella ulvae]
MKNLFLTLTCAFFIISCDTTKKYEGKWRLNPLGLNDNDLDYPTNIYIESDSIKFNYYSFDHWHVFPLEIKHNKFLFNNWKINIDRLKDTIFINKKAYVKDENDSIFNWWWDKPILNIELSKIKSKYFSFEKVNNYTPKSYIYFGKRIDNYEFSLQLNDHYAEINDIPAFLSSQRASLREELTPFFTTVLIIDKTTPLKYVEGIFHELKKVNQLKINFINSFDIKFNEIKGLYYDYEILNTKLPYLMENDFYVPGILKSPHSPPPPPAPFPFFIKENLNPEFVLLKNNSIYYNNKTISSSELERLTIQWVENKNAIFSLYDLESTYESFLEITATIRSVYRNKRNTLSKTKFNKPLDELKLEEIRIINHEIPVHHVWSFSIPHFNSIINEDNSFFGLKVPVLIPH